MKRREQPGYLRGPHVYQHMTPAYTGQHYTVLLLNVENCAEITITLASSYFGRISPHHLPCGHHLDRVGVVK
jgi:hypothetical protein